MSLLDIIFPPRCPFCGKTVNKKSGGICDECKTSLPYIPEDKCRICSVEKKYCECKKRSYPCSRRTAPFYYEDLARRGVVRFKKYRHFGGLDTLAKLVAEQVKKDYSDVLFDYAVGIPSTKHSLRERGYNQTVLLGKRVAKLLDIPFRDDILVRVFETKPQKGMSRTERIGNVAGAYDVSDPQLVEHKSILIIDDVFTTGATANECAKMLKIFGARRVYGASICVGVRRNKIKKKSLSK